MDTMSSQTTEIETTEAGRCSSQNTALFENPFSMEDLLVFDDVTMQSILRCGNFGLTLTDMAASLHGVSEVVVERVTHNVPQEHRTLFLRALQHPLTEKQIYAAQRQVLDALFWELVYWKTPELYEELTEGEQLHPGIFQQLEPDVRNKVVLDAGAGSGRASFECVRYGARLVYAVEPSLGLLHILQQKLVASSLSKCILPFRGSFEHIPLADKSVDTTLSCSAFTAEPEQGGEPGLAELQRVTKPGGKIVIIWPRREDYEWLRVHGFHYVALPLHEEMIIRFRSWQSAMRCARLFYAHNAAVISYLQAQRKPELPFSVLGVNPPRDYCWLTVQ
jgi:ubiquinone/menaquinone biosynthesis C-methylase UbiE